MFVNLNSEVYKITASCAVAQEKWTTVIKN